MEKHFLASSNTLDGFTNHFDSINPGEDAFTYVIKGGSGTGKSTFMKKIGQYFENKGYTIEYFYCSSDADSLDGVHIIQKGVAVVDGTSPHVTEAVLPGVKDKILNVGDFISPNIKKHKKEIESILPKKKKMFDLCYAYLQSAKALVKVEKLLIDNRQSSITQKSVEVLSQIPKCKPSQKTNRQLYFSYIDDMGLCSILSKNNFDKIINLDAQNYFEGFAVINKIKESLLAKKISFTTILSPLGCDLAEGIYLEKQNILIYNNLLPKSMMNERLLLALLKKAGKCVQKARKIHKKLEKYYINSMNFAKLTVLKEKTIQEIENM